MLGLHQGHRNKYDRNQSLVLFGLFLPPNIHSIKRSSPLPLVFMHVLPEEPKPAPP